MFPTRGESILLFKLPCQYPMFPAHAKMIHLTDVIVMDGYVPHTREMINSIV